MALPTTGYYVEVTIPVAQVNGSTNLTDFPVLLTRDSGSSSGDWDDLFDPNGTPANTNGVDIRCADSSGTQIACEVVSYSPDTTTGGNDGSLELWVKVPTLNATATATTIRVYWDGTTSSVETDTGVTPQDVWSGVTSGSVDYWANFHGNDLTDSTGNASLTSSGSGGPATTNPKVGDGHFASFSSTSARLYSDRPSNTISTPITVQAWLQWDIAPNSNRYPVQVTDQTSGRYVNLGANNSNQFFGAYGGDQALDTTARATGTYYLVHLVVDPANSDLDLYIDGSLAVADTTTTAATFDSVSFLNFWNRAFNFAFGPWNGGIDETRIFAGVLDSNWIATEYNNQSSPSTFATPGAKTTLGASSGVSGTGFVSEADDSATGAGAVIVAGTGTLAELIDSLSGVGEVIISGTGAGTENADAASGSGAVTSGLTGTGSAAELVDSMTGSGSILVSGSGVLSAADVMDGNGEVLVVGTSSLTEASDTGNGVGIVSSGPATFGTGSAAEDNDSATGAGGVIIGGAGTPLEASDTLTGLGTVLLTGLGSLSEISDTAAGSGYVGVIVPKAEAIFVGLNLSVNTLLDTTGAAVTGNSIKMSTDTRKLVQVTISAAATVTLEGSIDDTNWTILDTATSSKAVEVVAPWPYLRASCSGNTGTVTVQLAH